MRRFPRTTPWWVEQAYRDRQTKPGEGVSYTADEEE